MNDLIAPGLALLATLLLTAVLTWRDPMFEEPERAPNRVLATAVWPGACAMALGFMATLDYQLGAVMYGAAVLYAALCLATLGRPVLLFDRLLAGRDAARAAPLEPGVRRARVGVVLGVVAALVALVAVDRIL